MQYSVGTTVRKDDDLKTATRVYSMATVFFRTRSHKITLIFFQVKFSLIQSVLKFSRGYSKFKLMEKLGTYRNALGYQKQNDDNGSDTRIFLCPHYMLCIIPFLG